ncbi:MAG: imidazole glycerol phosphate synthase subunit HisF [Lentisphaerae bacterium]|mgnify:CR=1 FL=1|jgi:imidazole glycerol-phosphate synthase subunit HisF|nr:imidazole glycerol phosphate synthase subunit HisF [Lentisphaerota bacterium]MBT4814828.1 imidazole glycerol phosphate synthase subunit HisF [Lentisphaerota bacterium]MBT5604965.1 imidazole glycerol phosphate synthase subunit HisF [Lentisphaerota bacterium]MBT7055967.1 imidazole glycerol phosphate synthase subunit HisF [Lentisphaerota bacterium]MBT7844630.1 imidazole glycerol phosphate synthase subunit HisF [Lentisphaerota bacterium]
MFPKVGKARNVTRIIAKLDIKSQYVVKPIHFEGLRKIGSPAQLSRGYYEQGADEVFYIDIVASLYERGYDLAQIQTCAKELLVPFAVGGGVRSVDDFSRLFHAGADKVVINTHALQECPDVITRAARVFGSQAVVVNVEAKRWDGWWECYSDCGRIRSGRNVLEWVKEAVERGAGEVLLQSVDHDGRRRGFDVELIGNVIGSVSVPVVAASGAGTLAHIKELLACCTPSGVAIASLLHYGVSTVGEIKSELQECA